jgi:5S rRNA maturation endonuclease (ribonuclease M5)
MKKPLTPSEVATYYRTRVPQLNQRGKEWRGPCPIHGGKNPNFAVCAETGAFTCHSKCQCNGSVVDLEMARSGTDFKTAVAEVERIVGRIPDSQKIKPKVIATYDYCDETGNLLYQVLRYEPKTFKQRQPDGKGGFIWSTKGVHRVLYRLQQVKDAELVLVVEGEKDVHSLERMGYVATCNAGGAGKWQPDFAKFLHGKRVVVIPDEDEPGRQHADAVVHTLRGEAAEVRVVHVQSGKDVTDWITAGATKETIDAAIAGASPIGNEDANLRRDQGPAEHSVLGDRGARLPEIIVSNRQLRDLRADALQAMVRANTPPRTFARENSLVDLRSTEDERHVINNLTDVQVRGHLSDIASFYVITESGRRSCAPPLYLAKDILGHRDALRQFPPLVGITEIPVMRADGTILTQPGYDRSTHLYYCPAPDLLLPPVPDHPESGDIHAALQVIDSTIGDFPFVFDLDSALKPVPSDKRDAAAVYSASKANALSVMLTSVVRPAIAGPTPLALIDAPAAGTGKTLFAEVVAKIATGRAAPLFSAPTEDEEWRKQLTAYLREGVNVIVIDNVSAKLESGQLSKALTAETWADRLLGFNKSVIVPVRCTWMATGNNIAIGGDLPRRCFWIRFDAQMARPYLRTGFRHPNLRQWVSENRGALIAALLTLARAWYAAGRPQLNQVVLGSYESWAETIGGILEQAGVRGFLANGQELQDQVDSDSVNAARFLVELYSASGGKRFTSADVHQYCLQEQTASKLAYLLPPEIVDAVGRDDAIFERRMGKWFSDHVDTRFGETGIHIKRAGVLHHAQLWHVVDPSASRAVEAIQ